MQTNKRVIVLMVNVVCWGATVGTYAQEASKPSEMSNSQACATAKELLPKTKELSTCGVHGKHCSYDTIGAHLTESGFALEQKKKPDVNIAYKDVRGAEPTGCYHSLFAIFCSIDMPSEEDKNKLIRLGFVQMSEAQVQELARALDRLIADARAGLPYSCIHDLEKQKAEQVAFEQKAAEWRAMATKPAISDEVYKDRLLAENAVKTKDLDGAIHYYEAGVAADATWTQGWYNAALLHAEWKEYFYAADRMKRYVILMPDAPDAQTAKDNIILWEAKAETAKQ